MAAKSKPLSAEKLADLERAINSCLNDSEIQKVVKLTDQEMEDNYELIEFVRIKLKQRLNAKKINDAAISGDVDKITIPRSKGKRGGAQPGAGRPKGSTNKLSIQTILTAIQEKTGETFENLVAQGYQEAIDNSDAQLRLQYERMIVSKVVLEPEQAAFIDGISQAQGFKITFVKTSGNNDTE